MIRFLLRGKLLLYLLNLLLLRLLSGIPAFGGHFLIDIVLHAQAVAQGLVESRADIGRAGFDGAVHVQIAHAFFHQEQVLHQTFIIHVAASFSYTS